MLSVFYIKLQIRRIVQQSGVVQAAPLQESSSASFQPHTRVSSFICLGKRLNPCPTPLAPQPFNPLFNLQLRVKTVRQPLIEMKRFLWETSIKKALPQTRAHTLVLLRCPMCGWNPDRKLHWTGKSPVRNQRKEWGQFNICWENLNLSSEDKVIWNRGHPMYFEDRLR